jgi:hypothetical protein
MTKFREKSALVMTGARKKILNVFPIVESTWIEGVQVEMEKYLSPGLARPSQPWHRSTGALSPPVKKREMSRILE